MSAPVSKRRRIALACSACRTRKSRYVAAAGAKALLTRRCDGRRPVCGACSRMDLDCQYDSLESSANVILPKDHIIDLEQRLKHVEALLTRHDDLLTGHLSTCGPAQVDATPADVDETVDEDTDGMAITFVDESASAFFGESSNITFVRHLLRAITAIWTVNSERPYTTQVQHTRSPPNVANVDPNALPGYAGIEHLLTVYFNTMGLWFPIFDEAYFWAKHYEFKASNYKHISRTWLGVLNMVLAMATNIDQGSGASTDERIETSRTYYARATALCCDLARRVVTLDVVQYQLLVVLYLQGTQQSIEVWSLHGSLVSTALALGLHSEQAGSHLSPIERESRRRTWMTIYCLDKVLSVTFGRPPAIHEDMMAVQLPAAWPARKGTRRTKRDAHTTEFFRCSVQLYKLMGTCVARLYDANLGRQMDWDVSMLQDATEMRGALERWRADQPAQFAIEGIEFTTSSHLNRLKTTLALRYHNIAMLVDRPLLLATLRKLCKGQLGCEMQLAMDEAQQCVAAERTITIVHTVLAADTSGDNNLGVWFFTLYYVFTAALMVCGRMLWARHSGKEEQVSHGRALLTKAADALDMLDKGNRRITQCARYIRYLSKLQDGMSARVDGVADDVADEVAGGVLDFNDVDLGSFLTTELFDMAVLDLLPRDRF